MRLSVDQFRRAEVAMTPLLAYRAGPVATEAVYAFEDYAGEASAITVEPSEQFKLMGRLRSMGVPVEVSVS